jgi:hypothetical protein
VKESAVKQGDEHWYRRPRKRRPRRAHSPLEDVPLEALDERLAEQPAKRRDRSRDATAPLGLSHIACLLAGVALGIGLYALGAAFAKLAGADRPAKPPPGAEAPAHPQPQPRTPAVQPVRSADPAAIVRAMLKAGYGGRAEETYAYWGIKPDERAFSGPSGMYATLAEMTRQAARMPGQTDLSQCTFEVRKRDAQTARVGQYRSGVLIREYALAKRGDTWQVMACTEP